MAVTTLLTLMNESANQWPRLIAMGAVDTVIGVLALAWPGVTVLALAALLGILLLLLGALSIGLGLRLRRSGLSSGAWSFVQGTIAIIAGIVCLAHPGAGVAAIAVVVALWFLCNGVADLARASARREDRLWWRVMGVLSLIAAVVLLVDTGAAVLTIAVIVGISFLIRAAGEITVGLRLRQVHRAGGSTSATHR